MIRHIVLFKLNPGLSFDDPQVREAEQMAEAVGQKVSVLKYWQAGRNISDRPMAYDYVVIGLVSGADDLEKYMYDPFHQEAIQAWRGVSTWVIADIAE